MPVSDWSKLASFDALTFQIFVVADSAVATVNAFVAEAISFTHFVRVFVTRTVHFQISGPPFLPLFLRILAPSSRAQSLPFLSSTLLPLPPDLLLFFSFFSSSFSVSSWLFLVLLNISMALFLISSPFFFSSFSNFFAFSFCSSQTPSPIPPTPPPPF